ncbi:PREDICTED: rho GTPase-activating protein 26-like, partial [Priapulus caudatus]|uniref:Rho GTPase-activating protein 26-like n=1 Tax=Priapulus caudatus TaxID=37621 RepID=A0ABM1F3B5_PRICU
MGLLPLEFSDCLSDSPYFRENIHAHERELENTSQQIKSMIKECKDLLAAARTLSKAQRNFSSTLMRFKFECIGNTQTDDEVVIAASLKEFGKLISAIEDERDRMLERAYDQFILPLETF